MGDRVRYLSLERGDWEELPEDLVDWNATRKWENDHASQPDDASPAMKEAEEMDKEEAAERAEKKSRMPEVAKGLELPDQDGVFVLDTFQGTPELVELAPGGTEHERGKTGMGSHVLNPLAGEKAEHGARRRARQSAPPCQRSGHLSFSRFAAATTEPVTTHAMTVHTSGAKQVANGKHGAHSSSRALPSCTWMSAGQCASSAPSMMSPNGTMTQSEDVIPTKVEVAARQTLAQADARKAIDRRRICAGRDHLPFRHQPVGLGFPRRPALGDNPASLGPILK